MSCQNLQIQVQAMISAKMIMSRFHNGGFAAQNNLTALSEAKISLTTSLRNWSMSKGNWVFLHSNL